MFSFLLSSGCQQPCFLHSNVPEYIFVDHENTTCKFTVTVILLFIYINPSKIYPLPGKGSYVDPMDGYGDSEDSEDPADVDDG